MARPWKEDKPTRLFLEEAYERSGLRRPGRMWHQLRHTYASVLAAGGVKRHEVELLLGHRTAGTTGLYTHLFREAFEDVERVLANVYGGWSPAGARPPSPARQSGLQLADRGRAAARRF